MENQEEFRSFGKIARLSRDIIITEKIDGTNGCINITEDLKIQAGSRTRWITPQDDNYGFAGWVERNKEELLQLGPGRHFGEWWGNGIQRNYGLKEKRFSLFNVHRWCLHGQTPVKRLGSLESDKLQDVLPACVGLVPVLYRGVFDTAKVDEVLESLRVNGSVAAPSWMFPEGVVVFHTASGHMYKKTLEKDGERKSQCQ